MANCVNTSLPEFKALAEQTGMNPVILAAKISVWQYENNNLDAFPEAEELLHTFKPVLSKRSALITEKHSLKLTKEGYELDHAESDLEVQELEEAGWELIGRNEDGFPQYAREKPYEGFGSA